MKHTSGPWKPLINDDGGFTIVTAENEGFVITSRNGYKDWKWAEESKANANLIAAAPDLLAELEYCLPRLHKYLSTVADLQRIQALITKAKGE